jgi:hypothetical protein
MEPECAGCIHDEHEGTAKPRRGTGAPGLAAPAGTLGGQTRHLKRHWLT